MKKYSLKERSRLVDEYLKTELYQAEFCRQNDLKPSTLRDWLVAAGHHHVKKSQAASGPFLPIHVTNMPAHHNQHDKTAQGGISIGSVKIEYGSFYLEVNAQSFDPSLLNSVISVLKGHQC